MAEPSISVVIPTYNRLDSLSRTLDALGRCRQPAGGYEVIVVDDGSTEAVAGVVAAAQVGVTLLRQENAGPAAARNTGWRAARASVVAFTDDDCIPEPDWLVRLLAPFTDPAVVGVGGAIEALNSGFMSTFVQVERLVGHGADEGGEVRYLVTANAAYRREVLEAVGGMDESFGAPAGEDVDLSQRVREGGGRLVMVQDAVVRHDHRTKLGEVLRTYHRHGRARTLLAARHPAYRVASGASAALSWRAWIRSWRETRAHGVSPLAAVIHMLLRAAGLAAFAAGVARSR